VTISTGLVITGSPFIDGTLVALAPWGLGYLVYAWVARVRARRFRDELARPPLTANDAILIVLALVGIFLCWIPVAEVRKALGS
jgi:hypothetical protein